MNSPLSHYEYTGKTFYVVLKIESYYKRYSLTTLRRDFYSLINRGIPWKILSRIINYLELNKEINHGTTQKIMLPEYLRTCNTCDRKFLGTDMGDPFCSDDCKKIYFKYRYEYFESKPDVNPEWKSWMETSWCSDRKKIGGINHVYLSEL